MVQNQEKPKLRFSEFICCKISLKNMFKNKIQRILQTQSKHKIVSNGETLPDMNKYRNDKLNISLWDYHRNVNWNNYDFFDKIMYMCSNRGMKSGSSSTSIKLLINDEINWTRRRIIYKSTDRTNLIEFKCKNNLMKKKSLSQLRECNFCYLIKLLRWFKIN